MSALSSLDAEQSVLSLAANDPDRFIPRGLGAGLRPSSFSSPGMEEVFAAIVHLHRNGVGVDIVTVSDHLEAKGTLESVGGRHGVAKTLTQTTPSGMWESHLDIVLDKAAMRGALAHSERVAALAESGDTRGTLRAAQEAAEALTRAISRKGQSKSGKESAKLWHERWQELRKGDDVPGLSTGLDSVDAITGGLKPRELWIIGGQTSKGKSVLAMQAAAEAIAKGKRAVIFSLELGADEVAARLICYLGGVEFGKLTNPARYIASDGDATSADLKKITAAVKQIAESPVEIVDEAGLNIDTIESIAAQLHDLKPLDLVVVDYLQLVQGRRGRNDSREQEVASVSQALKQIAKKTSAPVVALSQLNDDGKLRESRAIGQDADVVMKIEDGLKILKNRNGESGGTCPAKLDGLFQRFRES